LSLEEAARKVCALEEELERCRGQLSSQFGNVVRLRAEASEAALRAATTAISHREAASSSLTNCIQAQKNLIEGLKADLELERGYSEGLKRELSEGKGLLTPRGNSDVTDSRGGGEGSPLSPGKDVNLGVALKKLDFLEAERQALCAERDAALRRVAALEIALVETATIAGSEPVQTHVAFNIPACAVGGSDLPTDDTNDSAGGASVFADKSGEAPYGSTQISCGAGTGAATGESVMEALSSLTLVAPPLTLSPLADVGETPNSTHSHEADGVKEPPPPTASSPSEGVKPPSPTISPLAEGVEAPNSITSCEVPSTTEESGETCATAEKDSPAKTPVKLSTDSRSSNKEESKKQDVTPVVPASAAPLLGGLTFTPKSRSDFKPSSACNICHAAFGFMRGQRNCRVCERSVCNDCSPSRLVSTDVGEAKARRVCNMCIRGIGLLSSGAGSSGNSPATLHF